MKEQFEIKGYWFLPGDEDNRVAGTLYFTPNKGIMLELIGSFHEQLEFLESSFNDRKKSTAIIWGESSDAKNITLIDCSSCGSLNFSASFPMQKFSVRYALVGIHLAQTDSAVFNSISVRLPFLTTWVNNYRVKYSLKFGDAGVNGFELGYHLDDNNVIPVQLDPELALEIEFSCTPPSTSTTEVLTVQQGYQLNFNSLQLHSFHHLLKKANRFNTFLQLGTLNELSFEKITLINPDDYQEFTDGRKYFHPVELFYQQHTNTAVSKSSMKDFLFTYDAIEGTFNDIIKKWFEFDIQMAPILKHLINSIGPKDFFDTGDFLVVVQALEGYATRFRPNIQKIGKKLTLKDQLNSLWAEFSFIPRIQNLNLNVDTATNSRHYYSHFFNKKANAHVADGVELYKLTQSLKAILICCVLTETGFDQQTMLTIMNKYKIEN
jgi:hypothetical protein